MSTRNQPTRLSKGKAQFGQELPLLHKNPDDDVPHSPYRDPQWDFSLPPEKVIEQTPLMSGSIKPQPGKAKSTPGNSYTLTENGAAKAVIVLASAPSCAAAFGAAELQQHIKKISGAVLPVVSEDKIANIPPTHLQIFIGDSAAVGKLYAQAGKKKIEDFKPQEYMIDALPQAIVLIGRDAKSAKYEYDAFPNRVDGREPAEYACRFTGNGQVINVPSVRFEDKCGTIEAWVKLISRDDQGVTAETSRTILQLVEPEGWSEHRIEHIVKKGIQEPKHTIRYTIHCYTATAPPTKLEYDTTIEADVLPNTWLHIKASYEVGAMPTLDVEFDANVSHGKGTHPVYGIDNKVTRCDGQVLGIGGDASLYTVGASPYRTDRPTQKLLFDLGIRGTSSTAIKQEAPSFEGVIAEVKITGRPGDTSLHLKFDESQGAKYVIDGVSGSMTAPPPDIEQEKGTLDAVYDFLENSCGVRWYAPMDIGVVYPIEPNIVVNVIPCQRTPSMPFGRRFINGKELLLANIDPILPIRQEIPTRDRHIWMLRMRMGGQMPQIGETVPNTSDILNGQCLDDAKIAEQVTRATDFLMKPENTIYSLVPYDGFKPCPKEQTKAGFNNELRIGDIEVSEFQSQRQSDYIFEFTNAVAQQVKNKLPKEMSSSKWIGARAYNDYTFPPNSGKVFESNIVLDLALNLREWCRYSQEIMDKLALYAWKERQPELKLILYVSYLYPAFVVCSQGSSKPWHFFPGFHAHVAAKQMKLFRETFKNIAGIQLEHSSDVGASYLMDQLEMYVVFKLAHDSSLDGDALIDEFFTRYYGVTAGPVMKYLYEKIEHTYMDPDNYPDYWRFPDMAENLALGNLGHNNWSCHQDRDTACSLYANPDLYGELAKLMLTAVVLVNNAVSWANPNEKEQREREKTRVKMFEQFVWQYMEAGFK